MMERNWYMHEIWGRALGGMTLTETAEFLVAENLSSNTSSATGEAVTRLRHCATCWNVAGSISDAATGIFYWHNNNNNNNTILLTEIVLSPGGSGYFTYIQNMKSVTNKFKSGGLHEKHVVATWNVGNRLSICL